MASAAPFPTGISQQTSGSPSHVARLATFALLMLAHGASTQLGSSVAGADTLRANESESSAGCRAISEHAKLTASVGDSDDVLGDRLGESVSITGGTVIAGARMAEDSESPRNSGVAYVFERQPGGWLALNTEVATLKASNPRFYGHLGRSVASTSRYVVAGARDRVLVFERPSRGWRGTVTETAELVASDAGYGARVAALPDLLAVSAPNGDSRAPQAGAVILYRSPRRGRSGEVTELARLVTSDASPFDVLGVGLAATRSVIAAGASGRDVDGKLDHGVVFVFERPRRGWRGEIEESAVLVPTNGTSIDRIGAVALSGSTVVVGTQSTFAARRGHAWVFEQPDQGWAGTVRESAELVSPTGALGDRFGSSLAIEGRHVLVGAPGQGSAYLFERPEEGWRGQVSAKLCLFGSDATNLADGFGTSVQLERGTAVVGARGGARQGAVYLFEVGLAPLPRSQ